MERFQRQIQLSDFGQNAQDKLKKARVLVIGAGGLGCPILMQLAAMGIGHLGIVDGDVVDLSNLHRQLLYTESDVNKKKVDIARDRLLNMNSSLSVEIFPVFITSENIFSIIETYDIVVDGTDQMYTRFLINDACLVAEKPWVYGAVYQYEGQVSVFNVCLDGIYSVNFRDLFPNPAEALGSVSCDEAGVLGLVPNITGLLMANEVIKHITGQGELLANRMLHYQLKNNQQYIFHIQKNKTNTYNPDRKTVETTNYMMECRSNKKPDRQDWESVLGHGDTIVVDVRSANEQPALGDYRHVRIPLLSLESEKEVLQPYKTLIFVCQTGVRSKNAFEQAKNIWPEKAVYHVETGIFELLETIQHG